ncbi:MAG: hypothetical protein K8T91_01105 [Planctomycetes bacterium]|nr:hypothetical protein [Planctomycetota bacterium]
MSPRHSDYRSEDFEFEQNHNFSYRRDSDSGDGRGAPSPANRPARSAAPRRKVKAAHNGIQRRRNKHWSW